MNSAVLQGLALTDPELRNTPDGSNRIATFLLQFPATKPEDAPFRLRVTTWNNLSDKAIADVSKGCKLIIEGRLKFTMIDRESYKEKRTELVADRIHVIEQPTAQPATTNYTQPVPVNPIAPKVIQQEADYDDIAF